MRSGNKKAGWTSFTRRMVSAAASAPRKTGSLPIYQVVNDTRLKEMIVSHWRPEDEW